MPTTSWGLCRQRPGDYADNVLGDYADIVLGIVPTTSWGLCRQRPGDYADISPTLYYIYTYTIADMLLQVFIIVMCMGGVLSLEQVRLGLVSRNKDTGREESAAFGHEAVLDPQQLEEFKGLTPLQASKRLIKFSQKYDKNKDSYISRSEMYDWVMESFLNHDSEEAMNKMEEEDENHDGQVTWDEYVHSMYGFNQNDVEFIRKHMTSENSKSDSSEEEKMLKIIDDDFKRFQEADENMDNMLNKYEYIPFFFPQNYPHMHKYELEAYMETKDKNRDGKLSFEEFVPEDINREERISAEETFNDFDKDHDGHLSTDELKPYLLPDFDEMANHETNHLFDISDLDHDGQLSFSEIIFKTESFVSSSATSYGHALHEEL